MEEVKMAYTAKEYAMQMVQCLDQLAAESN